MRTPLRFAIFAVVLALMFLEVHPAGFSAPASDTFIAAVRNQPTTLDPHIGTDNPSLKFLTAAYEPLIRNRFNTLDERNLEGVLARSWDVSPDGLRYTFRLRPSIRFHDGTFLDSESVKVSIDRMKAINLGNAFVLSTVREVRTLDTLTVQITLSEPNASFLAAMSVVYIVSARSVREHEAGGDWARAWLRDHDAGTGPYELQSWELGQQMTLRSFPSYWRGWAGTHVRNIVLRVVPEDSTQRLMVESGQVDWADTITVDDAVALQKNRAVQVKTVRALAPHFLMINTKRGPLRNPKVRQALVAAFNINQYLKHVMRGMADMPSGYLAPVWPEHDRGPESEYSLDRARALLTEAGFPRGGFSLNLIFFSARDYQSLGSQLYSAELQKLGITTRLEGMPFASMLRRMSDPDPGQVPDLSWYQVLPAYGSPDSVLYPTFHSKSNHWGHFTYENPRVDVLLDRVRQTLDPAQRARIYLETQKILREDAPGIPTMINHFINVFTARVKQVEVLPTNGAVIDYYSILFGN